MAVFGLGYTLYDLGRFQEGLPPPALLREDLVGPGPELGVARQGRRGRSGSARRARRAYERALEEEEETEDTDADELLERLLASGGGQGGRGPSSGGPR